MKKVSHPVEFVIRYDVFLVAAVLLLVRLLLLNWSDETDADGVSRVFTSWNWAKDPYWFKTSVWAPFHYYLTGAGFLVWKDIILLPKFIHLSFSVLLLFPFYYFTRREFNRPGAVFATVFLAFSPLFLRLGFLSLAEIPSLFFVVLAMNLLSKANQTAKLYWYLPAGFSMTVAAGFRYETWLLILLFSFIIFLNRRFSGGLLFMMTSLVFPVIWMIQSYLYTGDPLFSFHANADFIRNVLNINATVDFEATLRRIWFFPFSFLIATGPLLTWLFLKRMVAIFRGEKKLKFPGLWIVPLLLFLVVMIYNALAGKLLLHHRFSATLVILALPWIAVDFDKYNRKNIVKGSLSIIVTVVLSIVYTIGGTSPVPRLKNQSVKKLTPVLQGLAQKESRLIIDFIGWEDTWYAGLHSGFEPEAILMLGDENEATASSTRFTDFADCRCRRVFVVRDQSVMLNYIMDNHRHTLQSLEMFQSGQLRVFVADGKDQPLAAVQHSGQDHEIPVFRIRNGVIFR